MSMYTNDSIVVLTPDNFNVVTDSNEIWIIIFYAPWCRFSQLFESDFIKTADILKGMVKLGAVDVDKYPSLGKEYNAFAFPMLKIFSYDKSNPERFMKKRTVECLCEAAVNAMKLTISSRLNEEFLGVNFKEVVVEKKDVPAIGLFD